MAMEIRNWFVDINQFDPMVGSELIVREDIENNNGVNKGLMIIGLSSVNADMPGGLTEMDADMISACPDMLFALESILKHGLNELTVKNARAALDKAGGAHHNHKT